MILSPIIYLRTVNRSLSFIRSYRRTPPHQVVAPPTRSTTGYHAVHRSIASRDRLDPWTVILQWSPLRGARLKHAPLESGAC